MKRYLTLNLLLAAFTFVLVACGGGGDPKPQTPAAPTNVTATPGPEYVTVSWDDNSTGETGFVIYRDTVATSGLTSQAVSKVGEVGADTETFIDRDITIGQAYVYSVTARNSEGESAQVDAEAAAEVEAGVDLIVGTLNRVPRGEGAGTAFFVYYAFPSEGLGDGDVTATITGPDGWNADQAVTFEASKAILEDGWTTFSRYGIDAVAGEYQLEVNVKGTLYTATAMLINPDYAFPPVEEITVDATSATGVTVSWEHLSMAKSYSVGLWSGNYAELVKGYAATTETTYTFADLNLAPGGYLVEVVAWPFDITGYPVKVEPYGFSFNAVTFTIPPPESTFYPVDPTGTYLPRKTDDPTNPATAITLSTMDAQAGECLGLVGAGDYSPRIEDGRPDVSNSMIGVFHGPGGAVTPGPRGTQASIVTSPTSDGMATDIPEDFNVAGFMVTVQVPEEATELLFSPNDSFHSDNGDPDGDYGVYIAKVACL